MIVSSQIKIGSDKAFLKCVFNKDNTQIILDKSKEAKSITSHIFNFHRFQDFSKLIKIESGGFWLSEVVFEYKDFFITMQSVRNTSENVKKIKEDGRSRLTQVVKIEKRDNKSISIEEYHELQELMKYFFSFSKGVWINLSCSVGTDEDGEQVWQLLDVPKSEWKNLPSWFEPIDELNLPVMKDLFLLFSRLWELKNWQKTLKEVIYWFILANDSSRGVDAGIILIQTAIERLAFEYVVNDKKLLSSKGFKDLRASDKFRLFFSSLNIPLGIPTELRHLEKEAKQKNWADASHALTEIRNSLVHPEHKQSGALDVCVYSAAHRLSMWYLEVSILAICQYDGTYANRIKRGKVEKVPYAQ